MAAIAACHSTAAANQIILAKGIVFMQMDSRAAAGFRKKKLRKAGGSTEPRLASKEGNSNRRKCRAPAVEVASGASWTPHCLVPVRRDVFGNLNHLLLEALGFLPDEFRKAVFGVIHE